MQNNDVDPDIVELEKQLQQELKKIMWNLQLEQLEPLKQQFKELYSCFIEYVKKHEIKNDDGSITKPVDSDIIDLQKTMNYIIDRFFETQAKVFATIVNSGEQIIIDEISCFISSAIQSAIQYLKVNSDVKETLCNIIKVISPGDRSDILNTFFYLRYQDYNRKSPASIESHNQRFKARNMDLLKIFLLRRIVEAESKKKELQNQQSLYI